MKTKKIISQLKNLSKLDIGDLKNIDFNQIKEKLIKRKDLSICLGLSIVGLIGIGYLLFTRTSAIKELTSELTLLQQKKAAVLAHDKAQKELNEFYAQIPREITGDKLVGILNDYAVDNRVQIISFSPAKQTNYNFYELISTSVVVIFHSYTDIWNFIHSVENSDLPLRIEMWSGGGGSSYSRGANARLSSTVTISALNIMKVKK